MHNIEPYYRWRDQYIAAEDEQSPFFGKEYSEFLFTNRIYNYLIHPQWDDFGSATLFIKVLFVDYDSKAAILEIIGEWNDCLQNDIMILKTNIIDHFMCHDIYKFMLVGENILNFHGGDDDYYMELQEEISEQRGWFVLVNLQEHVMREMTNAGLQQFITLGFPFQDFNWRKYQPLQIIRLTDQQLLAPYLTS